MKLFVRNVDQLGRIVLPAEIRKINNLEEGDLLFVEVVPGGILLTPAKKACIICGSTNDLLDIDDLAVCKACAKDLGAKLKDKK